MSLYHLVEQCVALSRDNKLCVEWMCVPLYSVCAMYECVFVMWWRCVSAGCVK